MGSERFLFLVRVSSGGQGSATPDGAHVRSMIHLAMNVLDMVGLLFPQAGMITSMALIRTAISF